MAKNEQQKKIKKPLHEKLDVSESTIRAVYGIFLIFLTIFFLASAFNYGGKIGNYLYQNLTDFFGIGYYVFPIIFLSLAYILFKNLEKKFRKIKFLLFLVLFFSTLGFIDIIFQKSGLAGE